MGKLEKIPVGKKIRLDELKAEIGICERHTIRWLTALLEVRDSELWAYEADSFKEWVERNCRQSIRHVYRMLQFADVQQQIKDQNGSRIVTSGHSSNETLPTKSSEVILPESESQTRVLATVPEEDRGRVFRKSVENAGGAQPTARQIRQAARETVCETEEVDLGSEVPPADGLPGKIRAVAADIEALKGRVDEIPGCQAASRLLLEAASAVKCVLGS